MLSSLLFLISFMSVTSESPKTLLIFEDLYQSPSEQLAYYKSLQMRNFLSSGFDSPVLNLIDSQFIVSATIGSSGQSFRMVPEVLTSTSWVPSASCWSLACFLHSRYKSSQSSSFVGLSTRFAQSYGSGKVAGSLFKDSLHVQNISLDLADFGETSSFEGPSWIAARFDGVLSLQSVLLSLMRRDQRLLNRIEARLGEGTHGQPQTILGHCSEDFIFQQGNEGKFFEIEGKGLWIGQKRVKKELFVVFDLQTPLILFDRTMYALIVDKIKVDPKCKNLQELPFIRIQLQGVSLVLSPEDYILKSGNECLLGIVSWDFPDKWENTVVVGSPVLKKHHICYDFDSDQVGIKVRG
jgi:saccharopepsin